MLYIVLQHVQEIHYLGFLIHQGYHDDAEGILKLGMFIKLVQYHIRIGILTQLDHHPDALSVGLITYIRNPVYFLQLHQFSYLDDQVCLIYHVRQLCGNDLALSVGQCLYICHSPDYDLAPSRPVGLGTSSGSQNKAPCRKIRRFHDGKYLINGSLPVFVNPVIDHLDNGFHYLPQIMRRNIGSHAHGDTGSSVHQKIWIFAGKHYRFLFRIIEIRYKINRIFVNISQKLHGDFRKPGLRITHGGSSVTVHGTKVPVPVHQRISGGPILCHINQRAVNRAVAMGMIFTHGITYDTGAFTMGLVRTVIQFYHGIEHAALNRLQTVPHIRQRPGSNDTHGVVNIK